MRAPSAVSTVDLRWGGGGGRKFPRLSFLGPLSLSLPCNKTIRWKWNPQLAPKSSRVNVTPSATPNFFRVEISESIVEDQGG